MNRILLLLFTIISSVLNAELIDGFTAPSEDVLLSFVRAGNVAKMYIKLGDKVKENQILISQDSSIEKAKIEQLVAELKNNVKTRSETSKLIQKRKDLVDMEKAAEMGATSQKEIDTARLEVKQLELSIEMLAFEKEQLKLKIKAEQILLSQTDLRSPLNGFVESLILEKGESVQPGKEVIRIVNVQPLWIDFNVPLKYSANLKLNSVYKILFPNKKMVNKDAKQAKLIFISSVADPGSETLKCRFEVRNPQNRLAGERVSLEIGESK